MQINRSVIEDLRDDNVLVENGALNIPSLYSFPAASPSSTRRPSVNEPGPTGDGPRFF